MVITIPSDHTANLEIFDDPMSWLHVGWGVLAGLQNMATMGSMLALFTGYQVSQAQTLEPWQRTGGEFIEMAVGLSIAAFMRGGR
jgi:hypothetical protein